MWSASKGHRPPNGARSLYTRSPFAGDPRGTAGGHQGPVVSVAAFVLIVASLACASAGYIPSDHSHLSHAPAQSYSNVYTKNVAPVLTKTILSEPQYNYHGYGHAAPSVVVSKPLAITSPLPVSYAAPHSLYQAPTLVKNIEYSKPLSYAPIAQPIITEPAYTKTIIDEPAYTGAVSEPIYTKNVFADSVYPTKTLIAEQVYGKSILAQPGPIYGEKDLSYAPKLAYGGISAHGCSAATGF
uniref:Uncharacterized protein n=1 Tax=Anopheles dirus TaxID=7168 RepID=A0A182NDB0_9DIPT